MAVDTKDFTELMTTWKRMQELVDRRDQEIVAVRGELTNTIAEHKAAQQETQNALNAANTRIDELETKSRRPTSRYAISGRDSGDIDPEEMERKNLFMTYVRKGWFGMDKTQHEKLQGSVVQAPEGMQAKMTELRREMKAFSITDDTLGGYFVVPQIITDDIIKNAVLYSPVRELANVTQTSNNSVRLPVRTGTLSAGWISETGTRAESLGQAYGMKEIPTHEMYALLLFSRQLLDDSFFNVDSELQTDAAEQFGVL